jgi:hypothetical protein
MTIDKSLTWYLAGPMSFVPQFNVPLFDKTAASLRADGYTIISPAELDSDKMRRWALASPDGNPANVKEETGETWGDVLSRDVRLVADQIGGIIFLPNWYQSRGAKLEAFVGLLTGKQFARWNRLLQIVFSMPKERVQQILKDNMP